ncbi:hypothetical protein TRFO_10401 [Tritrichomonas foetus]|uniref:Uncharacterized protein n=1 Tax=Tritrichomonas foetus TaxID=1144522 RepID=A0A1J4J982_9EUKA|nr:hypothetical protein TRFO_10401 [Tritrichomonas foetus]|eukprot:OHS95742.1 hypothetical protein TRFO_10401 [Tritrichomonas foetus]
MSMFFYIKPNRQKKLEENNNDGNQYLRRERFHCDIYPEILKQQKIDHQIGMPCFSSYLPSVIFQNTVTHPYLLFYAQEKQYLALKYGGGKNSCQSSNKSIIKQLADYYNLSVDEFLSYAHSNVDFDIIAETWNKRFPETKSQTFVSPLSDFEITDVLGLQSLHTLAFGLNSHIILVFSIQTDYDSHPVCMNLMLGPDEALNNIHFFVTAEVRKVEKIIRYRNGETSKSYIYPKKLRFDLFIPNAAHTYGNKCQTVQSLPSFVSPGGGFHFFDIGYEKSIPFLKIPEMNSISDSPKVLCEDALFTIYKNSKSTSLSVQVQQSDNNKQICNFTMNTTNSTYEKMKKFVQSSGFSKNVVEKGSIQKSTKNENLNSFLEGKNILLAETCNSAYLVIQTNFNETSDETKIKINMIDTAQIDFDHYIISYKKKLSRPLTYRDLDHPLIHLLCFKGLIEIMEYSVDYLNDLLDIKTHDEKGKFKFDVKVYPKLDDNSPFFQYYSANELSKYSKESLLSYLDKLIHEYPLFLNGHADGQNQPTIEQLKNYIITSPSGFGYELYYFIFKLNKIVVQMKNSTIGFEPIIVSTIMELYSIQVYLSNIYSNSTKKDGNPINALLLQDVRSIHDFLARVTNKYFDSEEALKKNAENSAYPVKITTFIQSLNKIQDQQLPDPPYKFVLTDKYENSDSNANKNNNPKDESLEEDLKSARATYESKLIPKYQYEFCKIIQDATILPTVFFTVYSAYNVCFAYVSQQNLYVIAKDDEQSKLYIGHCETMNTEIQYNVEDPSKHIEGTFVAAVFMESLKATVICYSNDGKNSIGLFNIDGEKFDSIELTSNLQSLAVISKSWIAAFDENDEILMFKVTSKQISLEQNQKWRLFKELNIKELLLSRKTNPCSFIGPSSQSHSLLANAEKEETDEDNKGVETEIFGMYQGNSRVYSYITDHNQFESTNIQKNQNISQIPIKLNFHDNYDYSTKKSKVYPKYFPKKETGFNLIDVNCSLCEFFPSMIVRDSKVVTFDENKGIFSLFDFDFKTFKTMPFQIYQFYQNTLDHISLFANEALIQSVDFWNVRVYVVIDLCGSASTFCNVLFGTDFGEIDEEEIWSGFSCSYSRASLILLVKVNDPINIMKAISMLNNMSARDTNQSSSVQAGFPIFVCGRTKEQIDNAIRLDNEKMPSIFYVIHSDVNYGKCDLNNKIIHLPQEENMYSNCLNELKEQLINHGVSDKISISNISDADNDSDNDEDDANDKGKPKKKKSQVESQKKKNNNNNDKNPKAKRRSIVKKAKKGKKDEKEMKKKMKKKEKRKEKTLKEKIKELKSSITEYDRERALQINKEIICLYLAVKKFTMYPMKTILHYCKIDMNNFTEPPINFYNNDTIQMLTFK